MTPNDFETANKLAAISTALMCDTPTSMSAALLPEGHALDTAAYRDAVRTVRKLIDLRSQIEELTEVMHWAQSVLTAWNTGDMPRECLLHKKLREVMIAYREKKQSREDAQHGDET